MALLGVAAGFKSYTLILIPATALLLSQRSIVSAAKLTVAGLIPVALIFGPFVGHEFIMRVFQAHDSGHSWPDSTSSSGRCSSGRLPISRFSAWRG